MLNKKLTIRQVYYKHNILYFDHLIIIHDIVKLPSNKLQFDDIFCLTDYFLKP